jgi:hypothetical protein
MTYAKGDYVKVEFSDHVTGIGEWMWVKVDHCDDEKRILYGVLDNEPVKDYDGKIGLGSLLDSTLFVYSAEHIRVKVYKGRPSTFTPTQLC